jgi:hypothetical protein
MVAGKLTRQPVTELGWIGEPAVLALVAEANARVLLRENEPEGEGLLLSVAQGPAAEFTTVPPVWIGEAPAALADALAAFIDGGLYECEGCGMRLEASGLDAATSANEWHPLALVVPEVEPEPAEVADGGTCGECGAGLPSYQAHGSLCWPCSDEVRREA